MNKVCDYYTTQYNEDNRLSENCDNRHKVEREVKKKILDTLVKGKVLDIGAGTGLYSLYLASKGMEVTACDIVPEHIELIKSKANRLGYNVKYSIEDAISLTFSDNSFDTVLLAGPMYHLDKDKQIEALKEAYRVCKKNGIIIVDYLSEIHGYIQHVLLDKETLMDKDLGKVKDNIFYYNTLEEVKNMFKNVGIKYIEAYGTDSITRFIAYNINELDTDHLERWIQFIYENSKTKSIIDLSEHNLIVGTKL